MSEEVTTTETVDRDVEVATEVTETIRDEANTVIVKTTTETEGFGEGLDGDDGQLLAVILYGLVFFAVWYRIYRIANSENKEEIQVHHLRCWSLPIICRYGLVVLQS